ncbi:MAG: 7,8-dihydroneopterin aldolase [Alphaproteobacteria bacterium]|nr:MAG: 7,8-dihydroneopterin aldolase [Alphaproteobacteria bacterium]
MTQYRMSLKNCAFFARHGVYSEEEALGQRFFVDATLTVEAGEALRRDDIGATVDYGRAFAVIERVVTGTRCYLIEALALSVAEALIDKFAAIRRAEITIRKPNAPVKGILDHIEVTVVHDRPGEGR